MTVKKIIINKNSWQTRIAIMSDDVLQNVYFSDHATLTLERSYFKGRVTKILPGIQTAFVDIGQEKAGFLHISEVDRELAIERISKTTQLDDDQQQPKKRPRTRTLPDMSKIFKEGESILVQVNKEPIYEKGAKLTTCFTLPGRFIVLMPNIPRIGISKKIEDREERARLRDLVRSELPEGMGAIIRTTSEGSDAHEITKDIKYLLQTWDAIQAKFAKADTPEMIHEDLEISLQMVRDHLDDDVDAIITDDKENQNKIHKFIKNTAPEHTQKVALYEGVTGIFEHFHVEKEIQEALHRRVELKSGGSLIIETTEAMTVVDVNTGKFIGKANMEETIFKNNLEAAEEVVRQLRLRNIGGLIVIDFVDMTSHSNKQKLFKFFEKTLKERDKFQSVVLKISEFGLVQMTRKRSGKTLVQQLTETCQACRGYGFVKSLQTESYEMLRHIKKELKANAKIKELALQVNPQIFEYITSTEYNAILDLEKTYGLKISIVSQDSYATTQYKIEKK
jgi:ribonuclease G